MLHLYARKHGVLEGPTGGKMQKEKRLFAARRLFSAIHGLVGEGVGTRVELAWDMFGAPGGEFFQ